MNGVTHKIKHYYQTTNHNCSQASLAMLLSAYGKNISITDISDHVPVNLGSKGEEIGTVKQHLAIRCLEIGYEVDMYTFDCALIDQSWSKLSSSDQICRMKLATANRNVEFLGRRWSKVYMKSYIEFLVKGGNLNIRPYVSSKVIYKLLAKGPIITGVCYKTLHGAGHSKTTGIREEKFIDTGSGGAGTHSVVLYGNEKSGNILVADPWLKPGLHVIPIDQIISAISAAQIGCDNLLFQISINSN